MSNDRRATIRKAGYMSTLDFGNEIGCIHQAIMLARKFGADERFWKLLADNKELSAYLVDYAIFHYAQRFPVYISTNNTLVGCLPICFSDNNWVNNSEVIARVERFGRFVTDEELVVLSKGFQELWDMAACPNTDYPIAAISPDDMEKHPGHFMGITQEDGGRPVVAKLKVETFQVRPSMWRPGMVFGVVTTKPRIPSIIER